MKKILVAASLVVFVVFLAHAAYAGEDLGISGSVRFLSKDLGYTGGVSLNRPVMETSIKGVLWKGLYISVWHSTGINEKDFSSSQEMLWTGAWEFVVYKHVRVNAGLSYRDYDNIFDDKSGDGDYFSPFAEVGLPIKVAETHVIEPFTLFELAFPADDPHPDVGIYSTTGLKHRWEISSMLTVYHSIAFRYYRIQNCPEWGWLADYDLILAWKADHLLHSIIRWGLLEYVTLELPIFSLTSPIHYSHESQKKKTETSVGVGLSYRF